VSGEPQPSKGGCGEQASLSPAFLNATLEPSMPAAGKAEKWRKKAGGQLEDDPRKLGKDRTRLVGSVPLKSGRKAGGRRQHSPAPLAAFARRQ
jgi:hypothetical protein